LPHAQHVDRFPRTKSIGVGDCETTIGAELKVDINCTIDNPEDTIDNPEDTIDNPEDTIDNPEDTIDNPEDTGTLKLTTTHDLNSDADRISGRERKGNRPCPGAFATGMVLNRGQTLCLQLWIRRKWYSGYLRFLPPGGPVASADEFKRFAFLQLQSTILPYRAMKRHRHRAISPKL
jgi:hypothetical protein